MNILIVEDNDSDYQLLQGHIERYYQETGSGSEKAVIERASSAEPLLFNYKGGYDLIFMDIELPGTDGISVSRKIRDLDKTVVIVFVTNMKNLAIKGYEVDAYDFIVKPLHYQDFKLKFQRIEKNISNHSHDKVVLRSEGRMISARASEIMWIESRLHYLNYKLTYAEYLCYNNMSKAEEEMKKFGFLRCNRSILVNVSFIREVDANTITMVTGDVFTIGKTMKKTFMHDLTLLLGGRRL